MNSKHKKCVKISKKLKTFNVSFLSYLMYETNFSIGKHFFLDMHLDNLVIINYRQLIYNY